MPELEKCFLGSAGCCGKKPAPDLGGQLEMTLEWTWDGRGGCELVDLIHSTKYTRRGKKGNQLLNWNKTSKLHAVCLLPHSAKSSILGMQVHDHQQLCSEGERCQENEP